MYRRRHVRAIIEVLLGDLGFSAVLLHQVCLLQPLCNFCLYVSFSVFSPGIFLAGMMEQESVCATFGAGVSTACVVDVGASKTSVSCVEEGVSLQESR